MLTMIEDYFGPDNAAYVIWAGLAVAAILVALLVYLLLRRAFGGTYVAGGRNRRPRLAVLDAAAVDSRRRLVLVRRDETEHLILIGGPTDIVVESGIRPGGMPAPRPAGAAPPAQQRRPVQPGPASAPAQSAPPQRPIEPQVAAPSRPAPPPQRPAEPPVAPPARPAWEPPSRPQAQERTIVEAPPATEPPPPAIIEHAPEPASPFRRFFAPKPAAPPAVAPPIAAQPAASEADINLEDEMTRLLDELTDGKK